MSGPGFVGQIFAVVEERKRKRRKSKGRRGNIASAGRRGAGEFLFRTCKEQGEWAELCFMARARQMGMTVLKPYGDSSTYDVGIEVRGRLVRVQTKSTTFRRGRHVHVQSDGTGRESISAWDRGLFCGISHSRGHVVHPAVCEDEEDQRVAAVHTRQSRSQG